MPRCRAWRAGKINPFTTCLWMRWAVHSAPCVGTQHFPITCCMRLVSTSSVASAAIGEEQLGQVTRWPPPCGLRGGGADQGAQGPDMGGGAWA